MMDRGWIEDGLRMDRGWIESADVPLGKKVNNDHKPFEGSIDEDPKVEEGYDNANAQEVPTNNENVLVFGSKVTTTGESFTNVIPASRLASEIKVQHRIFRGP